MATEQYQNFPVLETLLWSRRGFKRIGPPEPSASNNSSWHLNGMRAELFSIAYLLITRIIDPFPGVKEKQFTMLNPADAGTGNPILSGRIANA